MIKLLHCADLHLSEVERDYSLNVLREIAERAKSDNVDFLLLCGDMFDSFQDMVKLRSEFARILSSVSCEILYIPGNHEKNTQGNTPFRSLDLGSITLLDDVTLLHREAGGVRVEFLAIPHRAAYSDYMDWNIPDKKAPFRIALAHGDVTDMYFMGLDDEAGAAALDPSLFQRFQVDYAALGHIHSFKTTRIGSTFVCYPGSARVWRSGEKNPRIVSLVKLGDGMELHPLIVKSAGQYKDYRLPLALNGSIGNLDEALKEWGPQDWIEISLFGVVEDDTTVRALVEKISREYAGTVRRLDIRHEPDDVKVLSGIASQPLAKEFLKIWEKRKPEREEEVAVWLKARELSLNKIAELME